MDWSMDPIVTRGTFSTVDTLYLVVLQALNKIVNKILYESYKVAPLQGSLAFFREKYCISASNRKDNILFKAKSSLFGSYILKKSAGNTLDKISYNYRY